MLLGYIRKIKNGGNPFYSISRISELTCKETVSTLGGGNKILTLVLGKMHNDNKMEVWIGEILNVIWGSGR